MSRVTQSTFLQRPFVSAYRIACSSHALLVVCWAILWVRCSVLFKHVIFLPLVVVQDNGPEILPK